MTNWETQFHQWFTNKNWKPHAFQIECAQKYFAGYNGLLNAPTGSGKTYALAIPAILDHLLKNKAKKGLFLLWITPLKALSTDIKNAIQQAADELHAGWEVALRNGDTSTQERAKQKKSRPQCLVTTPESLHLLLATKGYADFFKDLNCVVTDEWHELLGSKRGVQVELGLSRLKAICPNLRIWGISATIGNLTEARDVLIPAARKVCTVQSDVKKDLQIHTLIPDKIEAYPWAGHLGIRMLPHVLPVIDNSKTTLIFTNTRSQSEIWYQKILDANPDLAGRLAIHHGSITTEVRSWVEQMLHAGILKAVVCTSSLDLGVDFRPVDSVVQIGSPKGVARFVQRAGRSGHRPGETSHIWFLPTNSFELIEAACLKQAVAEGIVESRIPVVRAFDVLMQYLLTLAVSDGLQPSVIFQEIKNTHAYESVTNEEWGWLLNFITQGGKSLESYDEYKKTEMAEDGKLYIVSRKLAMQHRLSIGTIAGDQNLMVKMLNGKKLGTIEEYFISRLHNGDCFVFAGKTLELVQVEGMTAYVRKAVKKKALVPSWMGGRMSLTSELSALLRLQIAHYAHSNSPEIQALKPMFAIQAARSHVPAENELLIEYLETDEGHHLFVFPFEGRMVNEGMAMLLAYRLSKIKRGSYSIAMNDYGFELLSPEPIPLQEGLEEDIFTTQNLVYDLYSSTNYSEIARRRFSDIASISGLIYKGTADKPVRSRHLQAGAKLFYEVFKEYEPDNLLLKQAEEEAMYYQLEEHRLREALQRAQQRKLVIQFPKQFTPFSFPIMVDRMNRAELSNEKIEDRIARMLQQAIQ